MRVSLNDLPRIPNPGGSGDCRTRWGYGGLTLAGGFCVIPVGFCGIHTFDGIGRAWGLQGISWEAREGSQRPWVVLRVCGGDVAMCQEGGEAAVFFESYRGVSHRDEALGQASRGLKLGGLGLNSSVVWLLSVLFKTECPWTSLSLSSFPITLTLLIHTFMLPP